MTFEYGDIARIVRINLNNVTFEAIVDCKLERGVYRYSSYWFTSLYQANLKTSACTNGSAVAMNSCCISFHAHYSGLMV